MTINKGNSTPTGASGDTAMASAMNKARTAGQAGVAPGDTFGSQPTPTPRKPLPKSSVATNP